MLTYLLVSYSNTIPDTCEYGGFVCEVFYEKQNLNVWKVIFALFPRNKLDVSYMYVYLYMLSMYQLLWVQEVEQIYWSCDTGPIIGVHFDKEHVKLSVNKQIDGWSYIINKHEQQVIQTLVSNHSCCRYWLVRVLTLLFRVCVSVVQIKTGS